MMTAQGSIIHNFIKLRWLAITFQSLALIPGIYFNFIQPKFILPYLAVNFVLLLLNIYYKNSYQKSKNAEDSVLFVQLIIDVFFFSLLLAFSGGVRNPFSSLYFLHALFAGLFLHKKYTLGYCLIISLALIINQYISHLDHGYFYTLFISQWIILITSWLLARFIKTTLSKQAQQIKKLQKREYRKDRANSLGAMSAGLLHELATPLNTIGMTIDHLEIRDKENHHKEDLGVLNRSLQTCEGIIYKLREASQNISKTEEQSLDIRNEISKMIPLWKERYKEINIAFLSCEQAIEVSLSEINLYQALNNFINNCADENSKEITISLEKENESQCLLKIQDNGPGFPNNVLSNFGEPFITNKNNGTGLGLYSSLLIIENMGGSVELLNNNGAQVLITLPLEEKDDQ